MVPHPTPALLCHSQSLWDPLSDQLPTPKEMEPGPTCQPCIFLPFPISWDQWGGVGAGLCCSTAHLGLSASFSFWAHGSQREGEETHVHSRSGLRGGAEPLERLEGRWGRGQACYYSLFPPLLPPLSLLLEPQFPDLRPETKICLFYPVPDISQVQSL